MAIDDIIAEATGAPEFVNPTPTTDTGGGATLALLTIILYMLIIGGVSVITFIIVRNKIIFKFPIVIYSRRGNSRKTRYGKGGYIKKKGVLTFKIKWGWRPWDKKDLDFLPDTSLMDSDGRLHFDQYDPTTYIQKKVFHLVKPTKLRVVEFKEPYGDFKQGDRIMQFEHLVADLQRDGKVIFIDNGDGKEIEIEEDFYEPVPRDNKVMAIQEIKNLEKFMNKSPIGQVALIVGGILVLAAMFLGGYMLLTSS